MKRKLIFFGLGIMLAMMVLALAINKPAITGHSTFAAGDDAESLILDLASDTSFRYLGEGARFCIVVEIDNETTYYFDLIKYQNEPIIEERYCADPGQDNVIIKFNSYDYLAEAKSNPKDFFAEKRNVGYYIFPSNYVQPGGEVKCSPLFQERYCGAFYAHFSSSAINSLSPCCAAYTPTGLAFGFRAIAEYWWIPLIILTLVTIVLIFLGREREKEE